MGTCSATWVEPGLSQPPLPTACAHGAGVPVPAGPTSSGPGRYHTGLPKSDGRTRTGRGGSRPAGFGPR
jgi:hypothetical protein